MRVYTNLEELKAGAPALIVKRFQDAMRDVELVDDDGNKTSAEAAPFEFVFGGDVHIVETDEDLKEISTSVEDTPDRWHSIDEVACAFDGCEWLGDWLEVWMAWTDAGGDTYFVPRDIASRHPTVLASVEMTRTAWEGA